MSMMLPSDLGMRPISQALSTLPITRWLGAGHSASVYQVGYLESTATVLKLAVAPRSATPHGNVAATVTQERAVLEFLNKCGAETSAGLASDPFLFQKVPFSPLDHFPQVVDQTTDGQVLPGEVSAIYLRPVGRRLDASNIEPIHIDHAFHTLWWTHVRDVLHHDLSYNNLLLAPAGWRGGKAVTGQTVLVLIDWQFSALPEDVYNGAFRGTVITMSQRQLQSRMRLADFAGAALAVAAGTATDSTAQPYISSDPSAAAHPSNVEYDVEDELEAAVKAFLLILSPSLKRRVKRGMKTWPTLLSGSKEEQIGELCARLHDFWEGILPSKVKVMCSNKDYAGLSTYLKTELLHFACR